MKQSKKMSRQRSDTSDARLSSEFSDESRASSSGASPLTPKTPSLPESLEFANKYINLTEKERDLLASHLRILTKENFDGITSSASDFYQQFWNKWIVQDPVAAGLHETFSMTQRIRYVSNILTIFFAILKDPPSAFQRISEVAVVHAIWNISASSFGCMAMTWANSMRQVLGSAVVDDDALDLWERFIKQLGEGHASLYEHIVNIGRAFDVYHRQKEKWSRVVCVVYDKTLMLYKEGTDPAMLKAKTAKAREVIELVNFVEAYPLDDDSLQKKTEHCVVLESGITKEYFCTKSKAELTDFMKELRIRISTLSRMIKVDALLPGKYFPPDQRKALIERRRDVDEEPERVLQTSVSSPSLSPKGNRSRSLARTPSHLDKRTRKLHRMSMNKSDLYAICNDIAAPVLAMSLEGEIIYINTFAIALVEEAAGTRNLLGETLRDFLTDDSYATLKDVMKKSQSQRVQTVHLKFRSKDSDKSKGQLVNAQVSLAEVLGEKSLIITLGSKPVSTVTTSTYTRFESRQEATLVISEGGTILYANKRSQHFTGIAPEKLIGNSLNWVLPQAVKSSSIDWPQLLSGRSLVLETSNGGFISGVLEKEDGGFGQATYVWIEVPDSTKGSIQETVKCTLDVLADLPLPAMVCDSNGIILGLNDLAEDMFGYSSSELTSKSFNVLLPKHTQQEDGATLDIFKMPTKRTSTAPLKQFHTKDGQTKNLRVATSERVQAGTRLLIINFTK